MTETIIEGFVELSQPTQQVRGDKNIFSPVNGGGLATFFFSDSAPALTDEMLLIPCLLQSSQKNFEGLFGPIVCNSPRDSKSAEKKLNKKTN